MGAVRERQPEWFYPQTDADFFQPAMHDIGHYVHTFVERDKADQERLVALEGGGRARRAIV